MNLKLKFLIPTLSAAIMSIAVICTISYMKSSTALENSITEQAAYVSASVEKQVGSWIQERKNDLISYSREPVFTSLVQPAAEEGGQEKANQRLAALIKENTLYELIAVAGADGEILASSDPGHALTMNLSDRNYFKDSMAGMVSISHVIRSKASGNPIFVISSPVGGKNAPGGVMVGAVRMDQFAEAFIDTEKVGRTGYVYVVDSHGVVLAYPDKSKILSLDVSNYEFGRQMLARKNGVIRYEFEGIDKIVSFSRDASTQWIIASTANTAELFAPVRQIRNISIMVGGIGIGLIAAIIFFLTQSIVTPINRIISGMEEGAGQVAAASGQVSSSSQSMAEGASQQAAAIEESSSSMTEMASRTRENAENAGQAHAVMKEVNQVVSDAATSMDRLIESMDDITKASEETSRIIKTIDEIAFQTNLLALNAAVEAARAGEAGAGFAVVADEVRNLAIRAADAARDTAELIEGTVKKVGSGSELVVAANETFQRVAQRSLQVEALIAEISQASEEQSGGISQMNQSIAEIEKVVQESASNSEESAAASEEMNAQAEQLKEYVDELLAIVTGVKQTGPVYVKNGNSQFRRVGRSGGNGAASKNLMIPGDNEIRPDQVIPMDLRDREGDRAFF